MATIPDPPFTRITIDMPITGVTETNHAGEEFAVECVHFSASVIEDSFHQSVYAHGEGTLTAQPGDWLPTPPPEWLALADALRKSVES